MNPILRYICYVLALPLVLVRDVFVSDRSIWRKLGFFLILLVFFVPVWWGGYGDVYRVADHTLFSLGIIDKLVPVTISGTSMLPTLQDGQKVVLSSPKKFGISRGDIVTFHNIETGNAYYIKRVIGLENNHFSLKNGSVSINGELLREDYVHTQDATFGNTFITDCQSYTVPPGYLLVLGDNRIVSQDSRVVGFINKDDVEGVIKTHLTSQLLSNEEKVRKLNLSVNSVAFLETLNKKRAGKVTSLVVNPLLNSLAQKRAEEIKNNFDNWKQKSFSTDALLQQNGYKYNLVHEFVTYGFLSSNDVVDQIMNLPVEQAAFLSPSYMEVGIGVSEKKDNECAFPIISVILSWPTTPTYDQKTTKRWQDEADASKKILNQLQIYGISGISKEQERQIINDVAKESEIATRVVNKMKNKEWLSKQDQEDITQYSLLVKETMDQLNTIAASISSYIPPISTIPPQPSMQSTNTVKPLSSPTLPAAQFHSLGQTTIEPGITATLNEVQVQNNTITIKVTFANNSTSTSSALAPIRLIMAGSDNLMFGSNNAPTQLTLNAGEIRSVTLTYDKAASPPYTWKYTGSSGNSVTLGSYP